MRYTAGPAGKKKKKKDQSYLTPFWMMLSVSESVYPSFFPLFRPSQVIFLLISSIMSAFYIAVFLFCHAVVRATNSVPKTMKINVGRGLLSGGVVLATGYAAGLVPNPFVLAGSQYPVRGDESIMNPKDHGTSALPVQSKLKYGVDLKLADRICNYNRRWAENAGYFQSTSLLADIDPSKETTFYDSVTGKALFVAPRGRSFEDFKRESTYHGWPSFRDEEVVWENVRCLDDGETVSLTGSPSLS